MFGCAAQGSGASPLALSVSTPDPLAIGIAPGQSGGQSNPGEIVSVASATGGDGNYSFSWSLIELGDPDNALSIGDAGTTDTSTYNDAIIATSFAQTNPPSNPPPSPGGYRVSCTVTDGTGATATAVANFDVEVLS